MLKKRILPYICIILSIIITSCSSSSSSDPNASIAGQINLEAHGNHAGITVALYQLAQADSTLIRVKNENPNLGVSLVQKVIFDHRQQVPVKTVQTDNNGFFTMDGVIPGQYNLVLLKEGWSTKYFYQVQITSGENNLFSENKGMTIMKALVNVPTVINSPFTFQNGVQYIFSQNTVITASVNVEAGAMLCIAPGKKVDVYDNFNVIAQNNEYWYCTSSYQMNQVNSSGHIDSLNYFERLNFTNNATIHIKNAVVSQARSAVNVMSHSSIIEESIFKNNDNALAIHGGNIELKKCIFTASKERALYVIHNQNYNQNNLNHHHNIFIDYNVANEIIQLDTNVSNNYFISGQTGISLYRNTTSTIEYNNFWKNQDSVELKGAYSEIRRNKFFTNDFSDICFNVGGQVSNGSVHYNNFYDSSHYLMRLTPLNGAQCVNDNIDASNNYYKNADISSQLYDKYDDERIQYEIIVTPRSAQPVSNCGIQL